MPNSHLVRKIRIMAFFVCMCAACMCTFSPAHAASTLLESGTSGTCTWKYERVDGDTVLTIAPTEGTGGTLGSFSWGSSQHKGATKRVVVEGTVKVGPSAKEMFKDFSQATSIDVTGLDVAGVTNMKSMFSGCYALTSLDVSNWNVSNVTNMLVMFGACHALTSLDVSNWNVSNVTDMGYMFWGCPALTSLDVSKWNVSNVTDMGAMFYSCNALASLDVSNWDISNVTDVGHMFFWCEALTSLDVSKWNVFNVTDMGVMFYNCKALTSLDVSKWNVSNVTDMGSMFEGCPALTSLDVSKWNVSNVTDMGEMFKDCFALTSLDVSKWNVSNVTYMGYMFAVCSALTSLDVSKWNVSNVTSMGEMFRDCKALASLDVSNWNVSNVTHMGWIFDGCSALTSLDVSKWNVSNVTDMEYMFRDCEALTSLDLSNWKVLDKTQMKDMFINTQSLKQISLGSNFHIKDDAAFGNAGSSVGTNWMQINLGNGGTYKNPKGKVFESPHDLLAFHHDRTKRETDIEQYVRVAVGQLTINFNKGADDAIGEMTSQVYGAGETKKLAKNVYKRAGFTFSGWKDSEGNIYTDEQSFENNYFGKAVQRGKTLPRTLELVAQWEKATTLTYKAKEGTQITLSRIQEDVGPAADPLGCKVTAGVPYDKEVMWTVQVGGTDAASIWSHKGAKLGKDEIKAAALKDGKLVPTTFVAELVDRTYTITFDANVPLGTKVEGLPKPIVVKHGENSQVPFGITLSRSGYKFTGEWNDDKDGEGASYKAGNMIRNVFSPIILYAQWEKAITLTYNVKEDAQAFLSLSHNLEEPEINGDPLGSEVITDVPFGKEVLWTVQAGGNEYASHWSHQGTKLGKDEIKAAALKDGKLVSTTFIAELIDKTYTITFDANVPLGTKVEGLPDPIVVKHGQGSRVPFDITLSRPGYRFTGEWNDDKDGNGASYKAGRKIRNVFSHMILYAQWEEIATLTYNVKEGSEFSLSRTQEELSPISDPLGTEAIAYIPFGKEVLWTVQAGGNECASCWSYQGATLEKAEIEKAALKDGKLVSTTFIAELVDKTYTITFDANVPLGTDVKGLPEPIVVKHGQSSRIPIDITLSRPGYKFTGVWSDDKDGQGAFYRAGSRTGSIFSPVILYALWEEITTSTSESKEDTEDAILPCILEKTASSDCFLKCEIPAGVSSEHEPRGL